MPSGPFSEPKSGESCRTEMLLHPEARSTKKIIPASGVHSGTASLRGRWIALEDADRIAAAWPQHEKVNMIEIPLRPGAPHAPSDDKAIARRTLLAYCQHYQSSD